MSREPLIPHALILRVLDEQYSLDLNRLSYLDAGTAHAYRAEGPHGTYFLKLVPGGEYGQEMLERVRAEVPLLLALREETLERVPRPLFTRSGGDLAWVEGHPMLLYEWIEARNLGLEWQAALPGLAPLLGRLHGATERIMARIEQLPTPPEEFAFPFAEQLTRNLRHLQALPAGSRAGMAKLRQVLTPHLGRIEGLLDEAGRYQAATRTRPVPFAVCHTDAHGGNVMRDEDGRLWLIDWETARLAPPEHDLWMLGSHLKDVLPAYETALGRPAGLHFGTLAFYVCRRVLEDLAVDVQMILHEHTRPEEDAHTLSTLREYVLPDLLTVQDRLNEFRWVAG
ncbi:aminoglycoside phosphotransferase family protein [Deinococcus metallilatus]|uniref:Aminoglycoside phosphotransferase family protein n=1 Tax=Deinococcus metallilatus TaxID=1211322 RepID=A0AAJ5F1C4_9DEIO|nr:aminoglycoside phosphotransferase family protein [Deinococcus metallilatus]MBB5296876.1 Ser/Thr protein kinase RdoA (MazF antagonist) [Deinococcus metallilatus]QBY09608.1 aminoglycoside phosphotransferase family protein [Deinococcus metallilatus]RXJ09099.1 aminoglycoside phosphotransferase family protein [Deinococcus metallilatus]TLK20884.1 aminoglycoside phosphotransferase family protein [Deinococcus metallilatus]GMA13910.1 hypothetical protein GCM10025871_02410 [Deinococcus metallilatus]